DDGHAMVLVVVGEEGERAVRVHDLGAEQRAVPVHQLLEAGRAAHDVCQLARRHAPAIRAEIPPAIVLVAHACSPRECLSDSSWPLRFSIAPTLTIVSSVINSSGSWLPRPPRGPRPPPRTPPPRAPAPRPRPRP